MALDHLEPLNESRNVIVLGARSLVGHFLLPLLAKEGFNVFPISRKSQPMPGSKYKWHLLKNSLSLTNPPLPKAKTLISLIPLWYLPSLLPQFTGERLIAFGSTSVLAKINSSSDQERHVAENLAKAETKVAQICQDNAITWTIFRPTLTYGANLDKNVSIIMRFIKRYGFFPLLGEGKGLRQPVHASDLADACLKAIKSSATFNTIYNLSGSETLSYREMIQVVFETLQKRTMIVTISPKLLKPAVGLASLLPRYRYINMAMFERMNENLCFDHAEATQDFKYAPQSFRAGLKSNVNLNNFDTIGKVIS